MTRRLPFRLSFRARLTLVFGAMFLLAGVVLMALTYLLTSAQLLSGDPLSANDRPALTPSAPAPVRPTPRPEPAPDSIPPDQRDDMPAVVRAARVDALHTLVSQSGIALVIVGGLAVGLGWLVVGRMLQPLHRITETARRIADARAADRGLGERISLDRSPDEVKELADTFDAMLERLDHSFDGQRRFIANASHELRTPLTLNRTLIEVTLDPQTTPPELLRFGETMLAINSRHERLIDGLLLLARSERSLSRHVHVDLEDVAEHVAAQLPAGAVRVRTDLAEAYTTGDPVLLERLVQNLVENGVKHNIGEGGWVLIATRVGPGGKAVLEVSNSGQIVPRYEIPSLFEPFHRLETDRLATAPGAGLGLSIVRAVADAHGGEVTAEPREAGGLIVTVTLPPVAAGSIVDRRPRPAES